MKRILLGTRKYGVRFALVSDEDFDYLNQWPWTFHVFKQGTAGEKGYATRVVRPGGKGSAPVTVHMSRLVMKMQDPVTGEQLSKAHCDHEDKDTLNNQRYNLRPASRSQNASNSKNRGGGSLFKGVYESNGTGRWRSVITVNRKKKSLGVFDSEEDAARAYDKAAKILHGEFAGLNFPGDANDD